MNELQRTQYLEELGIDVFVPRLLLPAAKTSLQAQLPVAEIGSKSVSVLPASSVVAGGGPVLGSSGAPRENVSSSVSGIVTNIMGVLGGIVEPPKTDKAAVVAKPVVVSGTELAETAQDSAAFSLSLWRVTSSVMVIDTHHPKQALPTSALLSNILLAKDFKQRLPAPEILTWPVFSHAESKGSWVDAGDMVNAFLSARLSSQPAQYLWLMGESAFRAITQRQDYSTQLGAALDMPELSTLALVLPSLTEMLVSPELKRHTWSAIRHHAVNEQ